MNPNESKALRRKSLKVFDSGGFSSLAIARSQLQTPTVAWQRSSILLCDLVLATWTSGWLQWIQNGFKMQMWNYCVMWNELIYHSFGHASCVPRKKAASEWFAQRETEICDKRLSYWWPWIAQRHYHNSLCCASFALRSLSGIFLWTWRQKFLHKWRLATQLQPHGSSKSSSMVWFTQVVDVVVIVVDLTQHFASSAWSSGNLKVWHFWISIGQKIGKTWNHRNFNVMKLYEMKVQLDAKCWKHFHILFYPTWVLAMTFHKSFAEFHSWSVASRSFAREQHTLALTATYWLHLMTRVVSISNDSSLSQNFGLCVALQSSGHDVPNPK